LVAGGNFDGFVAVGGGGVKWWKLSGAVKKSL